MRRTIALVLLLTCLAACSGDDDESAHKTTTTLSEKGAFIAAADGICGDLTTQIKALTAPKTVEETALYLQERIVIATRARDALEHLEPPAPPDNGAVVLAALVDALDKSNAKATEAASIASAGDATKLGPLLDEARDLGHAAIPTADAYGMHDCGSA